MKKINLQGGFDPVSGQFSGGIGYEWGKKKNLAGPVLDIHGNGDGWAKETHGPVVIKGDGTRTVVRVSGSGGWKIVGGETISG